MFCRMFCWNMLCHMICWNMFLSLTKMRLVKYRGLDCIYLVSRIWLIDWRIFISDGEEWNRYKWRMPPSDEMSESGIFFRNVIISNSNPIVFTMHRLIRNSKRTSIWFQINWKMVNTIWFQLNWIRFLCVY